LALFPAESMNDQDTERISPMLLVKGTLMLAGQLGTLVFGFIFSFSLAAALSMEFGNNGLSLLGLLSGLLLTGAGSAAIRRRSRPWRIKYGAAAWALTKAERRRNPVRARCKRRIKQILVWVPSAIAVLVLFFFPVATHLIQPRSQYLGSYRVPIPWTFAVATGRMRGAGYSSVGVIFSSSGRGRFGMTPLPVMPFWQEVQPVSHVAFISNANAGDFDYSRKTEANRKGATEVLNTEFRLGNVALACRQYRPESPRHQLFWPYVWSVWSVDCWTSPAEHQQGFYAHFSGRQEDLRAFYQMIEGVRQVEWH
jgi:hypothetical protein